MWICEKCGRSFKNKNQGHYCGRAPETVDEYISLQIPSSQGHLKLIREMIINNVNDISEKILWSMPTYEKNGNSISFTALKDRVSFYVGEDIIKEFEKELENIPAKKSAIYFYYDKELPVDLISKIIKKCFE